MNAYEVAPEDFSLCDTLTSGQAFRFRENQDGSFTGVALGRLVTFRQDGTALYSDLDDRTFLREFVPFFALDEDYSGMKRLLSEDPVLRRAIAFAPGLRVMRQPLFETLITFILSQNNNIPRIGGMVERLCRCFGRERDGFFDFPEPETLAALREDQMQDVRAGYRAGYLIDAARKWVRGEIDQAALRTAPLPEASAVLRAIRGVGPKVACCTLLFGAGRRDAFPEDVWIKRAMRQLFPGGLPEFAKPCAGIAQQYIFHYARRTFQV